MAFIYGGGKGTYETTIDPLKKILKIIQKKRLRDHTKYLYNDMNVLPVKKLFYKASVLYTIKNNLTFKTEHGYSTRQISNIKVPTMHKKLTQSTYFYIGPKIYDLLLLEIKQSNSLKIIKKTNYTLATALTKYRQSHNKCITLLHYLFILVFMYNFSCLL